MDEDKRTYKDYTDDMDTYAPYVKVDDETIEILLLDKIATGG